jgi:hypothetical protein
MGMTMVSRINVGLSVMLALSFAGCDKVPLLAPTNSTVTLTTASVFVPTGGSTEVTAFVAEKSGTPVQNGTSVRFSTNLGRVDPIDAQTKNGYAVATFLAGDASGVADVRATSGATGTGGTTTGDTTTTSSSNVVRITVGAAASETVVLNASPSSVPAGGGTVTLIASVLDINGNRLRNVPINFSTDAGTLSATVATTDANGEARVELTTNRETNVTARAGAKSATLKILVNNPATIAITANPSSVPPGGGTVALTALVLDSSGNRLANVPVNFSTTAGTLSATQATTDSNGEARVQLTTSENTTVTARAGTASGTLQITLSGAITLTVSPNSGTTSTTFNFTVTPAQGAINVEVSFGDNTDINLGPITTPSNITHRYGTTGTFVIRATQTNTGGTTSAAVVTVTVNQ